MSRETRFLLECAVVGFAVGWAIAATETNKELMSKNRQLFEVNKILIRNADPKCLEVALEEIEIMQEFDRIVDKS